MVANWLDTIVWNRKEHQHAKEVTILQLNTMNNPTNSPIQIVGSSCELSPSTPLFNAILSCVVKELQQALRLQP